MKVQYISDNKGKKTGVFIPIEDWKVLQKHLSGLVELDYQEPTKADHLLTIYDKSEKEDISDKELKVLRNQVGF